MVEAVMTVVTLDEGIVITKVYRLEFEGEAELQQWLAMAPPTVVQERLIAE